MEKKQKAASALFLAPTVLKVKQSRSTGHFCETHISKHTKSNQSPHWALHCAVPLSILREGLYSAEVEMFFVAWPCWDWQRGPRNSLRLALLLPALACGRRRPRSAAAREQSPSILLQGSARACLASKPPWARRPSTARVCSRTPRQWGAPHWHFTQTSTKHNWCVEHHRLKGILLYQCGKCFHLSANVQEQPKTDGAFPVAQPVRVKGPWG